MLNRAIRELIPDTNWKMATPLPTNETEFLAKNTNSISESRDIIFSNNSSDFGITWDQIQAKIAELEE